VLNLLAGRGLFSAVERRHLPALVARLEAAGRLDAGVATLLDQPTSNTPASAVRAALVAHSRRHFRPDLFWRLLALPGTPLFTEFTEFPFDLYLVSSHLMATHRVDLTFLGRLLSFTEFSQLITLF